MVNSASGRHPPRHRSGATPPQTRRGVFLRFICFRKKLRHDLTPSEATLWKCLQRSRLDGRKFRRQHSVGPYILDFYCPSERLAVELDGDGHYHALTAIHDRRRDHYLEQKGIKVIRFENQFVFDELEYLLTALPHISVGGKSDNQKAPLLG